MYSRLQISFPEIKQADIRSAIDCLDECKQSGAPRYGFAYPYFAPGGGYGAQWWQLDSSLALSGYKWVDREFAERALKNFIESQKDDGRICLWGADVIPGEVAGKNFPKQTEGVSSLPKLFDVAYHILKGTKDAELKRAAYNMMKRYLDWWFSARLDEESGLISAVFEETFVPYLGRAGEYAPVDTNVEVYVGCYCTEEVAIELGLADDAALIKARREKLKESINKYLWDDEIGAYFPYSLKDKRRINKLMASTLFPLRMQIADEDKRRRLIELMLTDEHFGWNSIPLTSLSMKDPEFTITEGAYQGNASWSGSVWTLINETVVRGLSDCGEDRLAAELAMKTVSVFKNNFCEFINPKDGKGHGVKRYAWSASQFLELIIETVLGISYNATSGSVSITPRLTEELEDSFIELRGLKLSSNKTASVVLDRGVASVEIFEDKRER